MLYVGNNEMGAFALLKLSRKMDHIKYEDFPVEPGAQLSDYADKLISDPKDLYIIDITSFSDSEEDIVNAVIESGAPAAGLSALMTTTVPAMAKTIELLREKAPQCKIVVGGAVMNEEYARRIGADKYAKDAMETVRYMDQI